MASLVPEPCWLDTVLHFVLCDFGQAGRAFVETSPEDASREAVIRDIVAGQYDRPVRVLALDPAAGWSSDVTRGIAAAVAATAERSGVELTAGAREFIAEQLGEAVTV